MKAVKPKSYVSGCYSVGQRAARLSERRPAVLLTTLVFPFKAVSARINF
jgi:hypothetical protein